MFSFLYNNKKKANLTLSEQEQDIFPDLNITNTDNFVVIDANASNADNPNSTNLATERERQNPDVPCNLNMKPVPIHYLYKVPFNIPEFLDFANTVEKMQSEIDGIFAYFTKQIQIEDYGFILEREVISQ